MGSNAYVLGNVIDVSSDYTIKNADAFISIGVLSASITLMLPAKPIKGERHTIKDGSGSALVHNIHISGNGKNIDGAATSTLALAYASVDLLFNGSSWANIASGGGSVSTSNGYPGFNVKDFGAVGNGVADDTIAVQAALNAIMAVSRGGNLYFPAGTYNISYTLFLVGDYGHNYKLFGDGGGLSEKTMLRWIGPQKATMLSCWGLNWSFFNDLIFEGGAASLHIGGYGAHPETAKLGAGCLTWFHSNQFGTVVHPPVPSGGNAATFGVFFNNCSWQGVIGGLYSACAVGDGPLSPGDITVDGYGNCTIYQEASYTPPTTGANAVDTVFHTTLASSATAGDIAFHLNDVSGFVLHRAIVISHPGTDPFVGRIETIDPVGKLVTAKQVVNLPVTGYGIPWSVASGSDGYNVMPAAIGHAQPSGTIVTMGTDIQNDECQGFFWKACNFMGGGYDTTVLDQYSYACCSIYSGYNTEQFYWDDTNFFVQTGTLGIYSPTNPNNAFFLRNIQFGTFASAGVWLGPTNFAKLDLFQCATESSTGFGYLVNNSAGPYGGTTHLDGCEVIMNCIGNPYNICLGLGGSSYIERSVFQCEFGDLLPDGYAQPLALGCTNELTVSQCSWYAEEFQIPIFYNNNDALSSYFGSDAHPRTNRTHSANAPGDAGQVYGEFPALRVTLKNNTGTDTSGAVIQLPDVLFKPPELFSIGPSTNPYAPGAVETYRAQTRMLTGRYEANCHGLGNGSLFYICTLQPRMVIRSAIVEVTEVFSTATTLDMGSQPGSYADQFAGVSVPTAGALILSLDAVPAVIGNTWDTNATIALQFHNSATLTTGKLTVYLTTELLA